MEEMDDYINYDPFGQQRYLYTFENYCREDRALYFGDETQKVIVNTRGAVGEISKELREVKYGMLESLKSEYVTDRREF